MTWRWKDEWNRLRPSTKAAVLFGLALLLMGQTINMRIRNLNNIRYCDQFSGANAGARIHNCMLDLSAGGTADARGLVGSQAITQQMWSGITAPIQLITSANATYTSTVTQLIQCAHCGWDGQGGTYQLNSPGPYTVNVNDRGLIVSTVSGNISGPYTVSGAIAAGDSSFTAASSPDCSAMNANDWLILYETDTGLGDVVFFDWAQVASTSCPTINVYHPFRTAFPGTHNATGVQWYRIADANLVHDVTVKNLNCKVIYDTGSDVIPCMEAAHARDVTFDNVTSQTLRGQAFYIYRTQGFKLVNSTQGSSVNLVDSEMAESVDCNIIGNTFGNFGSTTDYTALTLDFGLGFCNVQSNHFQNSGDIALRLFHGVHHSTIIGNTFGWVRDQSGGTKSAIAALGSTDNVVMGNIISGADSSSQAISFANDSGATVNIASARNFVFGNNVGASYSGTFNSPHSSDTYIGINGPDAYGFDAFVNDRPSRFSGMFTCCNVNADGMTLGWDSANTRGYLGYNYKNSDGTESVNASGRESWRLKFENPGSAGKFFVDYRAASAGAGTFTNLFSIDKSNNVDIPNNDAGAAGGLKIGSGGSRLIAVYEGHETVQGSTGYSSIPIPSGGGQSTLNTAVTVTGASVNDPVSCNPNADLGLHLTWNARVTASDQAQVIVTNPTSITITPNDVSWRCMVFKFQ